MSEEQDERPGFRVTDRRRFGDARESADRSTAEEAAPGAVGAGAESAPADAPGADSPRDDDAFANLDAPVSFSTFVLGLSAQALMHLGEVEHPVTGERERDLPAAKHVIDVLGVLLVKTAGNLDSAEHALMDSVLYDLRMRYVELSRGGRDAKDKEGA